MLVKEALNSKHFDPQSTDAKIVPEVDESHGRRDFCRLCHVAIGTLLANQPVEDTKGQRGYDCSRSTPG
jgi:hypothetical protein